MKVLIAGQYGVFLGQLIDIFHKEGWEVYLLTGRTMTEHDEETRRRAPRYDAAVRQFEKVVRDITEAVILPRQMA